MGLKRFPKIKFIPDRKAFLVSACRDKVVLHLGCADDRVFEARIRSGRHLHIMLSSAAHKLYGVDIDKHVIEKLCERYSISNLYVGDAETLDVEFGVEFDVVLATELIEHLDNPGEFLDTVSHYMNERTLLILSTPNLLSLKFFLHSVVGNQRIPPDHTLGFTFALLETMLSRHKYHVVEWMSSVERFSRQRNSMANVLFREIFSLLPRYADTIIIVARRRSESDNG